LPDFPLHKKGDTAWGSSGKDARVLNNFRRLLKRISASDRGLLMFMAQKMVGPTTRRSKA
jgi:hypothetical protein